MVWNRLGFLKMCRSVRSAMLLLATVCSYLRRSGTGLGLVWGWSGMVWDGLGLF